MVVGISLMVFQIIYIKTHGKKKPQQPPMCILNRNVPLWL
uniref:Uncharacterized protein n=1 Tax=Medicago truncatula TaxID=3880 RepID=I3S7P0_MEDTR|nr:unknown [Medicago truncatula]